MPRSFYLFPLSLSRFFLFFLSLSYFSFLSRRRFLGATWIARVCNYATTEGRILCAINAKIRTRTHRLKLDVKMAWQRHKRGGALAANVIFHLTLIALSYTSKRREGRRRESLQELPEVSSNIPMSRRSLQLNGERKSVNLCLEFVYMHAHPFGRFRANKRQTREEKLSPGNRKFLDIFSKYIFIVYRLRRNKTSLSLSFSFFLSCQKKSLLLEGETLRGNNSDATVCPAACSIGIFQFCRNSRARNEANGCVESPCTNRRK